MDWAAEDTICDFGWEKVTQGTGYSNPFWPAAKTAMAARAAASGFVPGAYLFLEQGNGAAQADRFAAVAGDLAGFGLAVDVEPSGASRPGLADAAACVTRLRQHYPGHPVTGYIPQWYWGGTDTTFCDILWASHYLSAAGSPGWLWQRVPPSWWASYGGRMPEILQFTDKAAVPGVAGLVDCSAFVGTAAQYAALVLPGGVIPPPVPAPQPAPDWQVTMMQRIPVLTQGSPAHDYVKRAQALLGPAGFPVAEDGVFGPATAATVKRVQAAHGLAQDGIIGPLTWQVLITGSVS